jgi:NO-binding membrane sensor protein with MHYT domain
MWTLAAVLDGVIMALVMSVVGLWIITQIQLWRSRRATRHGAASRAVVTTCRASWPERHPI